MKVSTLVLAGVAGLSSSVAASAGSTQPPMGQFLGAFYTCGQGQAFQVTYESASPKTATLTTSNNNRRYQLKRAAGAASPRFTDGAVTLSLTGQRAQVRGTAIKLVDCKLKNTT